VWARDVQPYADMTEESLQRQLRRLHAELGRAQVRDPATRDRLDELAADIDRALESGGAGLAERLQATVALFEAEHPDLALLTARVIDALVKLGV
jgi:uncharacterized membrane-anchored protein YjiN (DUF445 family)